MDGKVGLVNGEIHVIAFDVSHNVVSQVVVLTGASSGIGLGIATAVASAVSASSNRSISSIVLAFVTVCHDAFLLSSESCGRVPR